MNKKKIKKWKTKQSQSASFHNSTPTLRWWEANVSLFVTLFNMNANYNTISRDPVIKDEIVYVETCASTYLCG